MLEIVKCLFKLYFLPATGMSPSSVHSNDVFCFYRNQCTLERQKQKGTEKSRMREVRSVNRSFGSWALNKVTYALRQQDALFICGYVTPE